jgi:TolB-like protein/Tfp pilus assembly protein PilF
MESGTRLGPYEILEQLGAGGMGEVYRAWDPKLRRDVAVKVLRADLGDSPERLLRLRREAQSLAALSHPNCAVVHGLEKSDGVTFIVMELVGGESLSKVLSRGALPSSDALRIAAQVAGALEAAHDRRIIHRDLKPANVKLTASGQAKVLDFGLARMIPDGAQEEPSPDQEDPTALTQAGAVMGTPPYMSPEQIRGQELDAGTDIWAFGCLLYELLTGRRAFAAETPSDTMAAVLQADPDWTALPPEVPENIRELTRRCLTKDRDQRLRHIGDARIELEEAHAALRGLARGTSRSSISWPAPARTPASIQRRLMVAAAAILGLAVVALVGYTVWGPSPDSGSLAEADRSIAVLPFVTLGQDEPGAFADGIHGDMLTRLSKVSDLRVVSRISVMRYRSTQESLPTIAAELGIAWALQGDVQQVGDSVQVNARLFNATSDEQVWAESYRRELTAENLFEIQSELTREIARQLQAQLSPEEERAVERTATANLDAYRLYVRGRALLEQRTAEEMQRAVEYFMQAIDEDEEYALAWAGLADALTLLRFYGFEPPATGGDAGDAARRAVALAPELAEARASLGIYLSSLNDGPSALRELRGAVALRPSYAETYAWIAWLEHILGRPERALQAALEAVEQDPLSPAPRVYLTEVLLAAGRAEDALATIERARELQPGYGLPHFMEGLALYHLGRYPEARAAFERTLPLVPPGGTPKHSEIRAGLGLVAAAMDEPERAREILTGIREEEDPFAAGLIHAALGEVDAALEAFGRVRQWGWNSMAAELMRGLFPEVLGPVRAARGFDEIREQIHRDWGLNADGTFPAQD